jgi:hypothetical protein
LAWKAHKAVFAQSLEDIPLGSLATETVQTLVEAYSALSVPAGRVFYSGVAPPPGQRRR